MKKEKEHWYQIKEVIYAFIAAIFIVTIPFIGLCIESYYSGKAPASPYYKDLTSEYTGTEVTMSNIGSKISSIELNSLSMKSNKDYYMSLDSEAIKFIKGLPLEYKEVTSSNSEETSSTTEETSNEEIITDTLLGETIDIYDYCVLTYTYENSDKTFVISKEDLDMIDISNTEEIENNIFEFNSSDNQITTYLKDRDYRLYNLELVSEDKVLVNKSNTNVVKELKNKLQYTSSENVEQEKVKINLDGLGELQVDELSCLNSAPGLYYTTFDGILRLYNYIDEIPYAFITNVDNYYFLCNLEDLNETKVNGLYTANGWDNPESTNYRTIALERTDEKGMYVIRVASEAPDDTLEEIVNQFGLSLNDI